MGILDPKPIRLVRHTDDPSVDPRKIDDDKISKLRRLLTGDNTLDLVRDAMIRRYAHVIVEGRKETGSVSSQIQKVDSLESTYADSAMTTAFQAGFFEITGLHMVKGIHDFRSCVYDGRGMRWEYKGGPPKLDETMQRIRNEGGHVVGYQTGDMYAVGWNVTPLYWSVSGNRLNLDAVSLDAFYWYFSEEIEEEGRRRPTNKKNLDEASAVAIRLGDGGEHGSKWAIWFGESETYPRGRHCIFSGTTPWKLPNPPWAASDKPDDSVMDYTVTGGMGEWKPAATVEEYVNPMTWHRVESGVHDCPEYPFALMYGDYQGATIGETANLGLYDISLEYDIAASITLGASQESALGKQVLTRANQSASGDVPQTVYSRMSLLNPGQDFKQVGWSAVNSKEAWEVALGQIRYISDSYHVPGFLVAPDWSNWPSGQAIRDAEHKLEKYRQKRINLNIMTGMQARNWRIQKALINMSERSVRLGSDVEETFVPGDLPWPEDPESVAREVEAHLKNNVYDLLDAIMRVRPEVETREQAVNLLKSRKATAKKLGSEAGVKLSVTDAPKFTTVNEARAAQGLPPMELDDGTLDPDANLTIAQFEAKQTTAQQPQTMRDRMLARKQGAKANGKIKEARGDEDQSGKPAGGLLGKGVPKPA